ncbi:uncharacterized protein [Primulina eburnea]|uniref:uncharacterized protein n=1 Tax=Primulina eburnea TaxID=1245227 RepID=UPI003C6C736A
MLLITSQRTKPKPRSLKSFTKPALGYQHSVSSVQLWWTIMPLYFSWRLSSIEPNGFCQKSGLCEVVISFPLDLSKNNKCDVCHNLVAEALLKLKDPDTELKVVELLLKACNSIKNNVQKCKRLVFEYAPIILVNAEKFLETNDVCTILHACDEVAAEQAVIASRTDTTMQSAS